MHGGDIYRNNIKMDFSVSVNPLGVPEKIAESLYGLQKELICYPDFKSEELIKRISAFHSIGEESVICGNGASELFMAAVHAIKPKKAMVLVPSFSGYIHALTAVSADIIYYYMNEENNFSLDSSVLDFIDKTNDLDILFLANPNNPVGNLIEEKLLENILKMCRDKDIILVLDECFIELSDKNKLSKVEKITDYDNLLLVRAFTKSFAIPAIRLGYMVGSDIELLKKIRNNLPEWNVSLAAQRAGAAAFNTGTYLKDSRALINTERGYMTDKLISMGIKVYPSETNFLLLKTDLQLYDELLKKNILIRDCSDFLGLSKGYYRIAIKTHEENEIILRTIKELIA